QPFSTPRSTALAGPPAGETCAPISIGWAGDGGTRALPRVLTDARPVRPLANRGPARRRGPFRSLQLADGPRQRRRLRPAHRGHRPRALHAGERRPDPRRAALARPGLGRGPDLPVPAGRPPPGAATEAARRGEGL